MFTNVNCGSQPTKQGISPASPTLLGPDPRTSGSREFCNPLEPPRPGELHEAPRSRSGLGVLDRLKSLGDPPVPQPRWWHWVLTVDPAGRLTLPAKARLLFTGLDAVRLWSTGTNVVLRHEGAGALTPVDRRGRVLMPAWLRRCAADEAVVVFVAARRPDASLVVVRPAADLDHMA